MVATGLGAQFGLKEETTHGTAVTVDRFVEFTSENVQQSIDRIESRGLRAGTLVQRSDRWSSGRKEINGPVSYEIPTKGFGILLDACFGLVTTSQPDATNQPTVYQHAFSPGDPLPSYTVQIGRPDIGDTSNPFTYAGGMVQAFDVSVGLDGIAEWSIDWNFQSETTGTSLETASYASAFDVFSYADVTLTVGGESLCVRSFNLNGQNSLNVDRRCLGSQTRQAPIPSDMRMFTGSVDADFSSLTAYNRFIDGDEAALVVTMTGALIDSTSSFSLTGTMNVRFDGQTPTVDGPDELRQPLDFKCVSTDGSTVSAIGWTYQTSDTTP